MPSVKLCKNPPKDARLLLCEKYKVSGINTRDGWGENEKKVAHGIGSEAREALRGQRNRTLQEHQEAGEREYVLQNPDAFLNVVTGRQFFRRVS